MRYLAASSVELTGGSWQRAGRWGGGTSLSRASKTGFHHHRHPRAHAHTGRGGVVSRPPVVLD